MKSKQNKRILSSRRASQSGFTLIEVLIAMLVLAFGLLGFALLQTMNVRFTKSAQQRTVATNLAYELVDMMRMQRSLGSYYNAIKFDSFAGVVVPTAGGCPRKLTATPSVNVTQWKCEVKAALPEGEANVNLGADGAVTVEVRWGDANWQNDEDTNLSTSKRTSRVTVVSRL
ncbi:MAG: type IV pilus modification protein PilV [Pseudoxanthomonas sp.]